MHPRKEGSFAPFVFFVHTRLRLRGNHVYDSVMFTPFARFCYGVRSFFPFIYCFVEFTGFVDAQFILIRLFLRFTDVRAVGELCEGMCEGH